MHCSSVRMRTVGNFISVHVWCHLRWLYRVQNPMWQQAMHQMLSNPEMLRSSVDAAAASNPQIRQMLEQNPSMRYAAFILQHCKACRVFSHRRCPSKAVCRCLYRMMQHTWRPLVLGVQRVTRHGLAGNL